MRGLLLAVVIALAGAQSAGAQIIDQGRIGPPLDPGHVIQQQNRPQNLPPAMAPQPYEFRNPPSSSQPQINPYSGSSYRARQVSRLRYQCSRQARRMKKSRRAAYINECVAAR